MAWVEGKGQDWTPTVTQLGAVAVTVTFARYFIVGEVAIVQVRLVATAAGTAGNAIVIAGQPAVIQPVNAGTSVIGSAMVLDQGTAFYAGALVAIGVTDWEIMLGDGRGAYLGASPSFALANTDVITFQAAYEI